MVMYGRLGMTGSAVTRGDKAVLVSKTMFAPGDWRPITAASSKGRATIRARTARQAAKRIANPLGPIESRGVSTKTNIRQIHPQVMTGKGKLIRTESAEFAANPHGQVQAASFPNGRGGGRIIQNSDIKHLDPWVMPHEMAHINPRRNPVSTFDRLRASEKANGREEGRADFLSRGKQPLGTYPGTRKFLSGYSEVQRKMAASAGMKKKRVPIQMGATKEWPGGPNRPGPGEEYYVKKAMSDAEARRLTAIHGTQGTLPHKMSRDERMAAYEARYIAAGGHKGEKWKRRSNVAETIRNAGVGAATVSAGAALATRSPRAAARMGRVKLVRQLTSPRAEGVALGAATASGASELYGEYARHKRASYASSPGGVAASALTRMRHYDPGAS